MRINALGNTATDFASDDYIALDGTTNGSRKMKNDSLLKVTSQNALAGNVAPAFDQTRTSENQYKAGESVIYEGKIYTFKVNHYGAWSAADVELYGDLANMVKNDHGKILQSEEEIEKNKGYTSYVENLALDGVSYRLNENNLSPNPPMDNPSLWSYSNSTNPAFVKVNNSYSKFTADSIRLNAYIPISKLQDGQTYRIWFKASVYLSFLIVGRTSASFGGVLNAFVISQTAMTIDSRYYHYYDYTYNASAVPEGDKYIVLCLICYNANSVEEFMVGSVADYKNYCSQKTLFKYDEGYQNVVPFARSFVQQSANKLNVEDTAWWTSISSTVAVEDDTSDYIKYGKSLKTIIANASAEGVLQKNGDFDFYHNILEFWIKTDDINKVSDIVIFLSTGNTNYTKYARLDITALWTGGAWGKRTATKLDWGLYGGMTLEDLANVKSIRFRYRSKASGNGRIWLNGVKLTPQKNTHGGLCLLFDDARENILTNVFPVLSQKGYPATTYVVTNYCENESAGYMTKDQLRILAEDGWVVGSHTKNHDHLQSLTDEALESSLKDSHDWLVENGFKNGAKHLAYPFGEHDPRVMSIARKYYQTAYSTKEYYNAEFSANKMALPRFSWVQSNRTVDYVKDKIKKAFDEGVIVIWYLHNIYDDAAADWTVADFSSIIDYVASIGCPLLTVEDVSKMFNMEQID